ncbi:MAG: hypothetical protein GYA24_05335 [Candidatus Lokiarchaeota archaeon]|nr:hypothetical protein [Candidatus Lokiarchaeota archaeon]
MMQLTHEEDLFAFIVQATRESLPGAYNIASDCIDFEAFYAEHGGTFNFIPWGVISLVLGLAGVFSRKARYLLQFYGAFRNPPWAKCDKIKAAGFTFTYPSTRDIFVEALEKLR